jgi:hypothetical protein
MPLDLWFKGPLAGFVREHLEGGLDRLPMLSKPAARALLDAHLSGRQSAGTKLWTLLVLSAWTEHFLARLGALRTRPPDRDLAGAR